MIWPIRSIRKSCLSGWKLFYSREHFFRHLLGQGDVLIGAGFSPGFHVLEIPAEIRMDHDINRIIPLDYPEIGTLPEGLVFQAGNHLALFGRVLGRQAVALLPHEIILRRAIESFLFDRLQSRYL